MESLTPHICRLQSRCSKAGIEVSGIQDILNLNIYITNAVKTPKSEYAVSKESIEESLPYLEKELELFPNLQVVMLMGDVAKRH
ncbi:uracil-DNA glycosylase family protein [Duncaniella muris]|uniref:uracil-DNA glycosylase family protein n=1 Tax=Duncaniella muris TaxID=2094150 RepID=UPI003F67B6CD